MILDHDALEALRSNIATRGVTSLSDDDPTDTEYLWAPVQDLTEARANVERLTGDLEMAANRIESMIAAYHDEHEGLSEYFEMHGAQHSQEECPEDDTCACPESKKLHAAWKRWGHEISDAYATLRSIAAAPHPPALTPETVRECAARSGKDSAELDARLRETFTAPDNDPVLGATKKEQGK